MIYRIKISIGYRDCYIDFNDATDAAEFASTLLEHYKQPEDESYIAKIVIEVINPNADQEDEE